MNKKRNVNYIKPEDPEFLKVFKRQAGYDDRNHKFDELQNDEEDFVEDDDSEQPQVVVLKKGDLTAEEAEVEKKNLEKLENETKADLSQKVIFKSKSSSKSSDGSNSRKRKDESKSKSLKEKKTKQLLSFQDDDDDDDNED